MILFTPRQAGFGGALLLAKFPDSYNEDVDNMLVDDRSRERTLAISKNAGLTGRVQSACKAIEEILWLVSIIAAPGENLH